MFISPSRWMVLLLLLLPYHPSQPARHGAAKRAADMPPTGARDAAGPPLVMTKSYIESFVLVVDMKDCLCVILHAQQPAAFFGTANMNAILSNVITNAANAKTPKSKPAKQGAAKPRPQQSQAPEFVLDTEQLATIGTQVGTLAVETNRAGDSAYATVRTHIVEAMQHGKGKEAADALFQAAYKVDGPKAGWLRTYKSVFSSALELGVKFDHATGLSALQKLIKAAKAPSTAEDMLKMALSAAKSAKRKGMDDKAIVAAIKEALAEVDEEELSSDEEGEDEGEE